MERWRDFVYTENHVRQIHHLRTERWLEDQLISSSELDRSWDDSFVSAMKYMYDHVNNRYRDNPWQFSEHRYKPAGVSGTIHLREDDNWGVERRLAYTINQTRTAGSSGHVSMEYDDQLFVTKAAADTNPSSAQVQGLVFAFEMRDLPSLVQTAGSTLAKFGANEYLKFQYGWKPLVKDTVKLFQITSKIRKRLALLQKLQREGTHRANYNPEYGSRSVYHDEGFLSEHSDINMQGARVRFYASTRTTAKRWAQVIWRPEAPPSSLWGERDQSQYEIARNAIYGLNLDGPTLWQAMPWSWLIDWFHSTSDYIKSQNNTVGATYKDIILMRDTYSETTITPVLSLEGDMQLVQNDLTFETGRTRARDRVRILDMAPEIATNPDGVGSILDSSFRMSILGALGVQRLK